MEKDKAIKYFLNNYSKTEHENSKTKGGRHKNMLKDKGSPPLSFLQRMLCRECKHLYGENAA
jgi:hypothetical protein